MHGGKPESAETTGGSMGNYVPPLFLTLAAGNSSYSAGRFQGGRMAIRVRPRQKGSNAAAMAQLHRLATPLPFDMKLILERDTVLKLALMLPEDVLSQALSVGKALQACAEHQRKSLGDQEEDCRKP